MGQSNKEVKVSKQELERAQEMWDVFAEATKYSIIGVAIVLILMALTLV